MSFALYLDEHVDPLVALLLRGMGHDVLTTVQAGNRGLADEQQLEYATANHRAILTYDFADYRQIAIEWSSEERHPSGVVIARRRSPFELRDRLLALFDLYPLGIEDLCLELPRLA